jgi:hypothetical protein
MATLKTSSIRDSCNAMVYGSWAVASVMFRIKWSRLAAVAAQGKRRRPGMAALGSLIKSSTPTDLLNG